jgi:hypothetical protein
MVRRPSLVYWRHAEGSLPETCAALRPVGPGW